MKKETVTLLKDGVLPIPDSIAEELNINTGDFLEFTIANNQISFKKLDREVSQEEFEENEFITKVVLLNEEASK